MWASVALAVGHKVKPAEVDSTELSVEEGTDSAVGHNPPVLPLQAFLDRVVGIAQMVMPVRDALVVEVSVSVSVRDALMTVGVMVQEVRLTQGVQLAVEPVAQSTPNRILCRLPEAAGILQRIRYLLPVAAGILRRNR